MSTSTGIRSDYPGSSFTPHVTYCSPNEERDHPIGPERTPECPATEPNPAPITVPLRRQFLVEIRGLKNTIRASNLQDPMTVIIGNWTDRFLTALNSSAPEEQFLGEFIRQLQAILQDSLNNSPLEEESYLGNDKEVYGNQALRIYLSRMSAEYRGRSPFAPTSERLFFAERHPVVEKAVQLLRARNATLPPLAPIVAEYTRLQAAGDLPRIPNRQEVERQERALHRAAEWAEVERRAHEADQTTRAAQNQARINRVNNVFRRTMDLIGKTNAREISRAAGIVERNVQLLETLRETRERWNQAIVDSNTRIDHLREELSDVNNRLSETERQTAQVRISIEQTTQEIANREAEKSDSMMKAVAIVSACIIASYALPYAFGAAAGSGTAAAGGGAAATAGGAGGAATGAATLQSTALTVAPTAGGSGGKLMITLPW